MEKRSDYKEINILIGVGARNCTGNLSTGFIGDRIKGKEFLSENYTFFFHTTEADENDWKYGTTQILVEGCKVITRVKNTDRLFLSKTKPR